MKKSRVIIPLGEGWKDIQVMLNRLKKLLNNDFEGVSGCAFDHSQYIGVYNSVYNMCTQGVPNNLSAPLYERHGEFMREYLKNEVLVSLKSTDSVNIFQEFNRRWTHHKIMVKWMSRFFMYLDRFYVTSQNVPNLTEVGLNIFNTIIYQNIKSVTTTEILNAIRKEREGENMDTKLIKMTIGIYEKMGMDSLDAYITDLEVPLLKETQLYYAQKGLHWLNMYDTPTYLQKVENALNDENNRVKSYLIGITDQKISKICEYELLEKHELALITKEGSGCKALLENKCDEHLSRMYRLFSKIKNGLEPIAKLIKEYIEEKGKSIINAYKNVLKEKEKDTTSNSDFIQNLIKLHQHCNKMVHDQFGKNLLFQTAMKDAFEVFLNMDVGDCSNVELLAKYCDQFLRTGGKKMIEEQVGQELEKVVKLFTYLNDKDLFVEIYRNLLAKRLLNKRSSSDYTERIMVGKLKLICGTQFTSKLEGVICDLSIGKDHLEKFKTFQKNGENQNEIDFTVQVLTTGYWPAYDKIDLKLPTQMKLCTNDFTTFYHQKNNNKKLVWVYSLGNCIVRMDCGKTTYGLNVTPLQAVILKMFSDFEGIYTFEEIVSKLNVSHKDPSQAKSIVKKILHSLSCGKYKVLTKDPKSKSITTSDKFKVNSKFKTKQKRLRIPMTSLEKSHNSRKVENNRQYTIEASLVRIMKSRSELKHNDLIAECVKQLNFFKPKMKVIKRAIERLIEREYLERITNKMEYYRYLA